MVHYSSIMKNTRIQVTIEQPEVAEFIKKTSAQQNLSFSKQTYQLIVAGIEALEDRYFDQLAKSRDTKKSEFILHEQAWS